MAESGNESGADVRRKQRAVDVADITLDNVRLGKISAEDLTILCNYEKPHIFLKVHCHYPIHFEIYWKWNSIK